MLGIPASIQPLSGARGGLEALAGSSQETVEGVDAGDHRARLDPPDHGLSHPGPGRQLPLSQTGPAPGLPEHPCSVHLG